MTQRAFPDLDVPMIRSLIASLERALEDAAPGSLTMKTLNRLTRWLLKPAEAMVRRWIWMLAAGLPKIAPKTPLPALPRLPTLPTLRLPAAPRAPAFRLTESLAGYPELSASQTAPGTAPPARRMPQPRPADPDMAAAEARLRRRLAALNNALNDLGTEARRLAARAARGDWLTLDTRRMPGIGSRALSDHARQIFEGLNAGALNAAYEMAALYAPAPGADTS